MTRDLVRETLLDLEATAGEVDAAMRAADCDIVAEVLAELARRVRALKDEQRVIRGRRAHLHEQYPALRDVDVI